MLRNHGQSLGRANADADTTAHAVERGNRHGEGVNALACANLDRSGLDSCRSCCNLFCGQSERADGSVRADICTLVTLNTLLSVPGRYGNSGAALLISCCAVLVGTVYIVGKCGYRQGVAVHAVDRLHQVGNHLYGLFAAFRSFCRSCVNCVSPISRNVDLLVSGSAQLDCLVVHVNDVLTLLQVRMGSSVLHQLDCGLFRHNLSQREECRLQNGVGALAHANLDSQINCVDGVQLNVVLCDVTLCLSRHVLVQLFRRPLAVNQEYAARLYVVDHLVALDNVGRVVACNEVSLVDIVRGLDRLSTEAQMRYGYAASLLGVVLEVSLYVVIGVVADNLDGVLVCTNGTVAAQTPELTFDGAFCCGVRGCVLCQRKVGDVIHDAEGELLLRLFLSQLFVYSEYGRRRRILGAQTVTAAAGEYRLACICQSKYNILIQRLALGARLLGAVENSNLLCGLRNSFQQLVSAERTVQANLYQTNLLALCGQVVDNFLCYVADGAHSDDNALSVRCTVVVEQLVVGAQLLVYLAHVLLNDFRNCFVVNVGSLAVLEEDVAVFVGTTHNRMLRIQCAGTELLNSLHVAHISQIVVIPYSDLLDLVRGAEAVEEVDERNAALDCCTVCNSGQVHNFLRVGLAQHSETGLATCHNVGMVAKDIQCVRSNGTCGYVEYARQQLACNLIHVRDHQQKTLRCSIGGGQSTCCQRAVYGAGSACLRLHFYDLDGGAKDVLSTGSCPLVNVVGHRAGRGNRINTSNFGKRIGYVSRSGIAVHGFHFSCHVYRSSYIM